jgi:hypothetical protein
MAAIKMQMTKVFAEPKKSAVNPWNIRPTKEKMLRKPTRFAPCEAVRPM